MYLIFIMILNILPRYYIALKHTFIYHNLYNSLKTKKNSIMSIKWCAFSLKLNVFCIGLTLGDIFCLYSSIDSFILGLF